MTPFAAVLRPEPGGGRTAKRLAALGVRAIRCPFFAYRPVDWTPPDADAFDALLLTSAAAPRLAGAGLAALRRLPVAAVGAATAAAARAAGLDVIWTGTGDAVVAAALARADGAERLLHLAGRDRSGPPGMTPDTTSITVYASEALPVPAGTVGAWAGGGVLVHSARAARRLAEVSGAAERAAVALFALSPAVLAAAGGGWRDGAAADRPDDAALCRLAAAALRAD